MTKEKEQEYKCKYCGRKIHKFDYEKNNGYCGKCREIVKWKRMLEQAKEFKK